MPSDLLERMRRNPAGDWHMRVPARRPIKPVYIRKLVRYVDVHGGSK
jgi:hypothetical protein